MTIRLFLIAFVFLPGLVLAQDQATDTERNPLDVFSGFIGPTWRADVSPEGSEEKVYDVSQWEWILGGKAIRIRHSVADGASAGETLLTWDERAKTTAYFYATKKPASWPGYGLRGCLHGLISIESFVSVHRVYLMC